MSPAPARGLLAIGLLAAKAGAFRQAQDHAGDEAGLHGFIPGHVGGAPHVRTRPAISSMPSGGTWAAAKPGMQQGLSRLPMAAAQSALGGPQFPESFLNDGGGQAAVSSEMREPVPVPVKAAWIVDLWLEDAAAEEQKATNRGDAQASQIMKESQNVLRRIKHRLDSLEFPPPYIFALTTHTGDVQAIATVTSQVVESDGEWKERVRFREVVAKPTARSPRDVIGALHRMMKGWVATPGRAIEIAGPPSGAVKAYYESLDFEVTDMVAPGIDPRGFAWDAVPIPSSYRVLKLET